MTPKQIELVRGTSDVLLAVNSPVASLFYTRLFELAPETRSMFSPDLTSQKAKLTSMLAGLIGALQHPDVFSSIIARTGQDHARLGVKLQDYDAAKEALLGALGHSIGTRFTPEVRDAWQALYAEIERRMLQAASSAAG